MKTLCRAMRFSAKHQLLIVLVFISQLYMSWTFKVIDRKIFADVTSNKLTREHDGSFGMWSHHGIAKESHAEEREFIFNADLVEDGKHKHIASSLYPTLGLTSDLDPVYQEYLLLQAQLAGIDGFLVEWGYKGHPSDIALQGYMLLARTHQPFTVGVNWCDHWLYEQLKNQSSQAVVETFHENLQYLMDTLFQLGPEMSFFNGNHPVIFLFGGGIPSDLFRELLTMDLKLPQGVSKPIWIGSYLNFASTRSHWEEWGDLLNGTFGWVPPRNQPTPPAMSQWDYYTTLEDVLQYQESLSNFGSQCLEREECVLWVGAASPQFDNRGCAGWGGPLKIMQQWEVTSTNTNVYDAQWRHYTQREVTTNIILIPTLNDYPESTVILATNATGLQALFSTWFFAKQWKQKCYHGNDALILFGFLDWYRIYKEAQFLGQISDLNVSDVLALLQQTGKAINKQDITQAKDCLEKARTTLEQLRSQTSSNTIQLKSPSEALFTTVPAIKDASGNYIINSTCGIFLQMNETIAKYIRKKNFKGYMEFQYKLLDAKFSHLRAISSTSRSSKRVNHIVEQTLHGSRLYGNSSTNFAEICNIMCKDQGNWHAANVTLYKLNQSWDHNAEHNSDVYFVADGNFLVRNIALRIEIWERK